MCLQGRLQRWVRDTAGVVRDRRGGDNGDHLEQQVLAKASRQKALDVLFVEASALFDQSPRQCRESAELLVRRRAASTHRLDIQGIETRLQSESAVERDRPGAGVGHSVGEQNCLDLRFGKVPTVNLIEDADKALG